MWFYIFGLQWHHHCNSDDSVNGDGDDDDDNDGDNNDNNDERSTSVGRIGLGRLVNRLQRFT